MVPFPERRAGHTSGVSSALIDIWLVRERNIPFLAFPLHSSTCILANSAVALLRGLLSETITASKWHRCDVVGETSTAAPLPAG